MRITGPGDETLTTGPANASTAHIRFAASDSLGVTWIGLIQPPAGTYRVELLPGSPAVRQASVAGPPATSKLRASVRRDSAGVRIAYTLPPRKGQSVRFYEEVAGVPRLVGTARGGPRDDPVPALTKRRRLAPRDRREIAQRRHRRPFTPSGASRSRSRRGPRRRHTSRSRAAETVSSSPGPEWRERPDTSSRSMAPMAARSSSGSPRRPTARQSPASRRRSEARCRCAQSGNSASPAAPPAPRSRRPERCRTDSSPTRSWASPRPKGARASFRRTPKSSERRRENADRLDSLHRLRSTVWPLAKRSRQRTRKGPS